MEAATMTSRIRKVIRSEDRIAYPVNSLILMRRAHDLIHAMFAEVVAPPACVA